MHSTFIYKKFETIPMLWMSCEIHHRAIIITLVGSELGYFSQRPESHQGYIMGRCHGWGYRPSWNGSHIYPIQTRPSICCEWALRSIIMPLPKYFFGSDLGFRPKSWITPGLQITIVRCHVLGSRQPWNGFHIHPIHMQGVCDHSYAVVELWDPS